MQSATAMAAAVHVAGFLVAVTVGSACAGTVPDPGPARTAVARSPEPGPHLRGAPRRLTRSELRQTLIDLVGLDLAGPIGDLPDDNPEASDVFAFDNKYPLQQPSAALVSAERAIAQAAAERVAKDPGLRARLLPCTPAGADDRACLRAFVARFGTRALRRPVTDAEIDELVSAALPAAVDSGDFGSAVALVVRVLLEDVEFLYRLERGTPVAGGLRRLTGHAVASRLSYFLWGTMPDDELLRAAATGERLQTAASVRAAATRMLADRRARDGAMKFHALWLGFGRQPPVGDLRASMLAETRALVERVLFDDRRPWMDLFRARETYVDHDLASHYGLPAPQRASGWVPYDDRRGGILSHASFLGVERKHADTSPTMRGAYVRTRLLCEAIGPPPPTVAADEPPAQGRCKSDRYVMWKTQGCRFCHTLMDPIGHGLENFDRAGRFRTVAPGDEEKEGCEISGAGELVTDDARVPFDGIAGLSQALVSSGALEACAVRQLAHYLVGRELRDEEEGLLDELLARFRRGERRYDEAVLALVALPSFRHRIPE